MLGFILYELGELALYSSKMTYNMLYSIYNWNNKDENNIEIPKEVLEKLKKELREEIKNDLIKLKDCEEGNNI